MQPDWNFIWSQIRKYLINKYVITLVTFAVLIFFVGNSSILHRIKIAHETREKESELREYQARIDEVQRQIDYLDNPDSLEAFAREQYLMHAEGEDIYLVDE